MIRKIALLFLTFFVGLTITQFWFEISPPVLTLCEVAKNPKQFEGKKVRLAAFVQTHYGFFMFQDEDCNFGSLDAIIQLPENYTSQSEQVQLLLDQNNQKYLSAQTIIEGRINTKQKYHDHQPKFVIEATEISLISEITVEPNTPQQTEY